jgi:hypothetical protein
MNHITICFFKKCIEYRIMVLLLAASSERILCHQLCMTEGITEGYFLLEIHEFCFKKLNQYKKPI